MNIYVQIFLLLFILFTSPLTAQVSSNNSHYLLVSSNTPIKSTSAVDFEVWLKSKLQLSEKITLNPLQKETDPLGFTHQRYQILQSGIPVEGAIFISHSDEKDNLTSSNGNLFHLPNIAIQPSITPEEALLKALEYVNAKAYRWEIEAENQHRNTITKGKKSSYLPTPQLVIAPKNLDYQIQDFRLSYKIDIYALQPFQRLWVYVDAQTAEIIATQNQICEHHSSPSNFSHAPTSSCPPTSPKSLRASVSPYSPPKNLCASASLRSPLPNPPRASVPLCSPLPNPPCASVPLCSPLPNPPCASVPPCFPPKNLCASASLRSPLPNPPCASVPLCSPKSSDTPATAITKYSGTQTITTFKKDDTYLLQEEERNIYTYNTHQGNLFSQATIFEDEDNYWDNFNEQQDEVATDAHWGAEQTYDYFLQQHGRKSFDGKGIAVRSYVHFIKPSLGPTFNNAFWDGEHLVYGDGDGIQRGPSSSLDICAHEFTHAVTDYTANLINLKESGALNESFSDIFAIAIEHHVRGEAANFLFGEEVVLDGRIALRSAINPKKEERPDTYGGEYWSFDQVHHRSNVQTHWFYLLVNGGTGINDLGNSYEIEGIGLEKAADIAYRNLTVYLTPPSGYADARFFSIRAAMDLFGDCSFEVQQVAKAWQAVGVGAETLEVVAAFTADETEFCSSTASVQFSNHSLWADSFTWDFGDGNTSQEVHPTHTYQGFGEYAVELTAHSCQGETATITKEKWVYLGEDVASCNEVITDIAEQQIFQDCRGILYDDGGAEEDYSRLKKSQVRIEVPDADYLTLDFLQFDTGNNHELRLYDGKDNKAPEIGAYWGSRLPNDGAPIVTRSNVVHLQFDPLGGENRSFPGFAMEWQCHSNTRKPLAEFTSNDTFLCQGQVSFLEKSYYQATEWYWDFGDGNQSEEQNPIHTYREKGTYDVQLIACNAFGCDTLTQVGFVNLETDSECFEVQMPRTGKKTVNHCSGKIFDNGGDFGFYGNNVSGTLVVEPPNAERIGFAIQTFATEAKDDLLLVYDGDNVEAPLLLSQSGFDFSKDTIWAESGAVTFYFRSDEAVFNPGFEIVYFSEFEAVVPQAAFSWSLSEVPIAVPLSFQNQSQNANQWLWDFGDGNVSKLKNPVHVYAESGTYTATLIAENCYASDTLQKTIQVQSMPVLELDKQELTLILPAGESGSQILELSNVGTGDLYFGIENRAFESDTTVEKYYTNLGVDTYFFDDLRPFSELRFELTINGDFDDDLEYLQLWVEDDYILQVGINNQSAANGTDIEASFSFKASNSEVIQWLDDGQLKIAVGRSNQVALNQGGKDYYRLRIVTDHRDWLQIGSKNGSIGGGTQQETLLTFNAQNLWAGTYANELHIFSNDTPNSPKIIPCTLEVVARPIAQFRHQIASFCDGSVNFWEETINEAESWTWDFGDGTTSNEQNPTHKYAENGSYEVTLEVCKSGFCDEITEAVDIAPIAKFVFSPNDVPQETEIRFSNQSVGFNSYEWDFGDGHTSTDRNPKHRFEAAGNYVVTLVAKNCFRTDTLQKEVKIQGLPQAVVPVERVEVSLEAGQQTVESVAIQNIGSGDLSYQAAIKREYGESTAVFEGEGATTFHVFEGVMAEDFLQLKVTLNGDFDKADERVWIRLEGEGVAYVLDNNTETNEDETHFVTIAPELYRHLLVDGVLEIELVNSQEVEARADRENKHSVELIAFGVPWVETTGSNQTVSIGEERNLLLTFDARELNAGVYEIPVVVTSNESPIGEYVIPTRLEVFGEAELDLVTAIDFGEVRVEEVSEASFQVFNSGTDTLFVSEWSVDSEVFGIESSELTLAPKEMYEGVLTFQPTEIADYAVNLEIQSNVGTSLLELKGKGIGAPQILVMPDSLWVVLEVGKQTSRVLTTSNVGTAEMLVAGEPATFIRFDSLSTQGFVEIGDTTWHVFEGLEEADSVRLDFVLEGDFNETWEFVEVFVNGVWQGKVGAESGDSEFVVGGSLRFAWEDLVVDGLEEGRLELMLVNSEEVNTGLTAVQSHAVRLQTFDVPWVEGRLEEDVVGVGESQEWEVFFDASDLPIGIYRQDVHLFSDDVERDLVVVPTTLEVVKILGAEEEAVGSHGLRLYPNPTTGKVTLVYDLPTKGVFQLFDLQGRELKNEGLPKGAGEKTLRVEDLVSGMYLYHLSVDGRMMEKGKLLLMR